MMKRKKVADSNASSEKLFTTVNRDLYVTLDEYLAMLRKAIEKVNSLGQNPDARHHPEDISIAVEIANECLYVGMSELIQSRHNIKYLSG